MPIPALELACTAIVGLGAGWLASATAQARRFQRERERREREMANALRQRHEVYDTLEQSVLKLITRFDRMESEFKLKLAAAENPGLVVQQTVTLRSRNPELWDIEREHQRIQARLLGELAKSRSRSVELMQQLQALEPETQRIGDELARTRKLHERAAANARESEQAALSRAERIEKRAHELEHALAGTSKAFAAAQAELAQRRGSNDEHVEAAWAALCDLRPMLDQLERAGAESGTHAS